MLPHDLNVDLHMHSTASDGVLRPAALVSRGKDHGVQLMAITDHDTIDGLAEGEEAALDLNVPFLNGVEISVTWGARRCTSWVLDSIVTIQHWLAPCTRCRRAVLSVRATWIVPWFSLVCHRSWRLHWALQGIQT